MKNIISLKHLGLAIQDCQHFIISIFPTIPFNKIYSFNYILLLGI